jgi:hypothetical protein
MVFLFLLVCIILSIDCLNMDTHIYLIRECLGGQHEYSTLELFSKFYTWEGKLKKPNVLDWVQINCSTFSKMLPRSI